MRVSGNTEVLRFSLSWKLQPPQSIQTHRYCRPVVPGFLSEAFGSLHAHVHYFSHTQFWVLSELFCPLSFSKWLRNQYSVLKLVLLMWLCVKSWGMCKSPVYSPTSAPPAKEHWVHTEGCSVRSACFSAWYRLTYPPTYHFSISPSLLTFRCLFFYLIFSCFKDSSL